MYDVYMHVHVQCIYNVHIHIHVHVHAYIVCVYAVYIPLIRIQGEKMDLLQMKDCQNHRPLIREQWWRPQRMFFELRMRSHAVTHSCRLPGEQRKWEGTVAMEIQVRVHICIMACTVHVHVHVHKGQTECVKQTECYIDTCIHVYNIKCTVQSKAATKL